MEQTIVSVEMAENRNRQLAGNILVSATLSGGSVVEVFAFYDDELHFSSSELVGLTPSQAVELKHRKDVAYLQS